MAVSLERRSLALQARFVDQFESDESDVRFEPEVLFAATRLDTDISRQYYAPTPSHFHTKDSAFFKKGEQLPDLVSRSLASGDSLMMFPKLNGGMDIRGQYGQYSFYVTYFPHPKQELTSLALVGMDDGKPEGQKDHHEAWMPYWSNIQDLKNADQILNSGGTIYNREVGVFEARVDDLIVRAKAVVPINQLLEKYFPLGLRKDPFGAGIEHDVWARSDWMQDFGISWNRVVEVPVFSAS